MHAFVQQASPEQRFHRIRQLRNVADRQLTLQQLP